MKKTSPLIIIIEVLLAASAIFLGYYAVNMVLTSINFQKETTARRAVVIKQIKDIRTAQFLFKQANNRYTSSFDTLIDFAINGSITLEKKIGSADDSVAVAQGKVKTEKFQMPVKDSLKLTDEQIQNLRYIPFAPEGTEFRMEAGVVATGSKVVVPVFECRAPYKDFLHDMDQQEVINLINERKKVYEDYPGIKVGGLETANQGEGNWGE